MASIGDRVKQAVESKQGIVLSGDVLLSSGINAVRFYAGYARLICDSDDNNRLDLDSIDSDTDIASGEWSVIKPLFLLYIELEQAISLEASRGLGIDVYGRSSSEISMDIKEYESLIPSKSFCEPIISVGGYW